MRLRREEEARQAPGGEAEERPEAYRRAVEVPYLREGRQAWEEREEEPLRVQEAGAYREASGLVVGS